MSKTKNPEDSELEPLLPMPPDGVSDMELYSSNLFTRDEITHQNSMIQFRNEERLKKHRR